MSEVKSNKRPPPPEQSAQAARGAPPPRQQDGAMRAAAVGQLVWCPTDPLLGIGLTVAASHGRVSVQFLQTGTLRQYTTRSAEVAILRYVIEAGELVGLGEERVRVRQRLAQGQALFAYALEDGRVVDESALVPQVRDVGAKERLAGLTLAHPEAVRARMLGQRLRQLGGQAGLAAVFGARAEWLPHQLDVASQALGREPVRLLLADEVGLGKTVEAALIFAGLRAQGRAARVLVLTPEALCIQWLQELYRKSHEMLVLFDRARMDDARADFPEQNVFEAHQRMVASIDAISRDPILARDVEAAPWDLVIVDEAHHLRWQADGGGNLPYRLVEALASKTRHLLLLTATPMALDPGEYQQLLRLLDANRFPEPAAFDQLNQEGQSLREVAKALSLSLERAEPIREQDAAAAQALLLDDREDSEAIKALCSLPAADAKRPAALSTVLDALRERHALSEYVMRNRRGPVGGLPARTAKMFALAPSKDQELLIEVGEEIMLELAQTVPEPAARGRLLGELLRALWATPRALVDILRPDSETVTDQQLPHLEAVTQAPLDAEGLPTGDRRLAWLAALVRGLPAGEKLLVFVETNVAVRALRDALAPLSSGDLAVFHRDLSPRDQDRQVAWFRDPAGPQVMLSTEAGGEGRNFQFCHKVVLYDLPWRPATVEQRIGRIDRVGQKRDVEVLVPHFASGFEAAIAKVMQQSIGVLGETVGGIDHALEYVAQKLADLILQGAGAEGWKALFQDTAKLVREARARIAADVDPVLDHASFSPARVQALLAAVPADLEAQLASFLAGFAEYNRIDLTGKGGARVVVEGAASAAGAASADGFVGTFSRQDALDHEDVDFLSFGHPLVEQALDWSESGVDASAGLALARGFAEDGAAFIWQFILALPEQAAAAAPYVGTPTFALAVDESGQRREELEALVSPGARRLDRMDATPLRGSIERWRLLVERNYASAEQLAAAQVERVVAEARQKAAADLDREGRAIRRRALREMLQRDVGAAEAAEAADPQAASEQGQATRAAQAEAAWQAHAERSAALLAAIDQAQPKLTAVLAVRLVRKKEVSA